jgi:hypothetical protein
MMLTLEKLPKKAVLLKTKKLLMLKRTRNPVNQNKPEVEMMVPPKKKPIKKLLPHSAHQSFKVCAERMIKLFTCYTP